MHESVETDIPGQSWNDVTMEMCVKYQVYIPRLFSRPVSDSFGGVELPNSDHMKAPIHLTKSSLSPGINKAEN
jgi:hypothetical protein